MVQKLSLKDWKQSPLGEESIYILIATMAGFWLVGIAQATVAMFGLPAFPTQETSTVCMG